jgi:hemolysin III
MSFEPAKTLATESIGSDRPSPPRWWDHCAPVLQDRIELANSLSHGFGLLLALIGAAVLLRVAAEQGSLAKLVACAAYSASLVAVYAASTLSHLVHEPRLRAWFRSLDQGCIFLLIVGTYTPFGVSIPGWNWPLQLLVLMWIIALAGFVSKVFYFHRIETVSVFSCVLMGWMPCTTIPAFMGVFTTGCLWLMLGGGLAYTIGTLFLVNDRRHWFFHAVWHLFVIAGSTLHYLAILWYAVPA